MSTSVTTVSRLVWLCSRAHSFLAPSIWRRLLIQALAGDECEPPIRFGIAMTVMAPIAAITTNNMKRSESDDRCSESPMKDQTPRGSGGCAHVGVQPLGCFPGHAKT